MNNNLMIVGVIVMLASFGSTLFSINWRIILQGIIIFSVGRLLKTKQQLYDTADYYNRI